MEKIRDEIEKAKTVVVILEDESRPDTLLKLDSEYEDMLYSVSSSYNFFDLDENNKVTTLYTIDITGKPKGVHFSSNKDRSLHRSTSSIDTASIPWSGGNPTTLELTI